MALPGSEKTLQKILVYHSLSDIIRKEQFRKEHEYLTPLALGVGSAALAGSSLGYMLAHYDVSFIAAGGFALTAGFSISMIGEAIKRWHQVHEYDQELRRYQPKTGIYYYLDGKISEKDTTLEKQKGWPIEIINSPKQIKPLCSRDCRKVLFIDHLVLENFAEDLQEEDLEKEKEQNYGSSGCGCSKNYHGTFELVRGEEKESFEFSMHDYSQPRWLDDLEKLHGKEFALLTAPLKTLENAYDFVKIYHPHP